MKAPPVRPRALCAPVWLLLCLFPPAALAQAPTPAPAEQDLGGLSLKELLGVEVSTASKFPQTATEAPASVTVLTADDLRRHGHRTLADALRSVRGFYTTYDRNYSYVGIRGFARPGDYNTRILLLIDGHRVNDGVYDMAPLGTDFLFDVSLIERIEVIRGAGSSLYGTNALFAVINVITKTGGGRRGVQVSLRGGALDTLGATASVGREFGDGRELLFAGSTYRSSGQRRIHIPEFDDGGSPAIAADLDDDEASSLFGSLAAGRFSVRAGAVHRVKSVPTASFGTVFGDGREATTDNRAFFSGVYDGPFGRGWMGTARIAYDYYGYQGAYPTPEEDAVTLYTDQTTAHAVSGELTARRRIGQMHLLTAGVEMRRDLHNHQTASDGAGTPYLDINVPGTKAAVYVQDELRPASWLLLNAGMRVDRFSDFGSRVTPRAGIVLLPRRPTAIKLLYGRAFRAPNPYERYYYTSEQYRGLELQPEQIRSSELVWEESVSNQLRFTLTAFSYDVERIIEQRATAEGDIYFENAGRTRGRGFEAEAEARFDNGIVARAGHTFARVRDHAGDLPVSNSPQHLSNMSLQLPVSRLVIGLEGQRVGERLALDGSTIPGFFAPNLTVTTATGRRFELSLSVYNALNRDYADPGAEEHLQPSIRQDGRAVQLRVHIRF
ncbi:MAG: TonB-dependent receptor plug domain-containing protein [Vicinamibacterales bacterium]